MNRADYMAALRRALSVLPEEERANALRYYEMCIRDSPRGVGGDSHFAADRRLIQTDMALVLCEQHVRGKRTLSLIHI